MRLLVIAMGLLNAAGAFAQAAGEASSKASKFADPAKVVSLPSSGVSSMGQVTVALVMVLLVVFAAAWLMRRFKLFNRNGQGSLEVVQGINLGPKERAVLIKVQNRCLLLGVAPGCVNLLLELPVEGETPSGSPEQSTSVNSSEFNTPSFKALLKRSMGLS